MARFDYPFLWRFFLVFLLVGSGLFDMITFFLGHEFWAFESNPIMALLGSKGLVLMVCLKVGILTLMSWYLVKPESRFIKKVFASTNSQRFLIILAVLYLSLFQVAGGISNMRVVEAEPPPELAPTTSEKLESYSRSIILPQIIPLLFSLLAFKLWEWGNYQD